MAKETIKEMIRRIVKEERGYERISTESALNKNPIHPQWENKKYKIVRMAYDDEGTNVFVLVDKMGKKIVSYSITGRSEFAKFQELSKRIKSDSVKESATKKRRAIKESDNWDDSPHYYVEEIGGDDEMSDNEYAVFFSEDDKYANRMGTGKRYFRGDHAACKRFADKKNKELESKSVKESKSKNILQKLVENELKYFLEASATGIKIYEPTEEGIQSFVDNIKSKIKLPYIYHEKGGLYNPSELFITFCFQSKENWPNRIFLNSTYFRMTISYKGVMEVYSSNLSEKSKNPMYAYQRIPVKFRKSQAKNADDAIAKIDKFVKQIKDYYKSIGTPIEENKSKQVRK